MFLPPCAMLAFDLFTQIKDVMLKHVLDQTAALPRRYKCQHDEGEDCNAVLFLLCWEAGVMNVWPDSRAFLPVSTRVRMRAGMYLARSHEGWRGVSGSGNPI